MCFLISFLQQPRLSLCHVEWLPCVDAYTKMPLVLLLLLRCRIVISGAQFAMSDCCFGCCISDVLLWLFFPPNLYFSSLHVHVFPHLPAEALQILRKHPTRTPLDHTITDTSASVQHRARQLCGGRPE